MAGIDDIATTQRLWSLRGHAGRRAIVGDPVVFCSAPRASETKDMETTGGEVAMFVLPG